MGLARVAVGETLGAGVMVGFPITGLNGGGVGTTGVGAVGVMAVVTLIVVAATQRPGAACSWSPEAVRPTGLQMAQGFPTSAAPGISLR